MMGVPDTMTILSSRKAVEFVGALGFELLLWRWPLGQHFSFKHALGRRGGRALQ
jgi:hypothetical protein